MADCSSLFVLDRRVVFFPTVYFGITWQLLRGKTRFCLFKRSYLSPLEGAVARGFGIHADFYCRVISERIQSKLNKLTLFFSNVFFAIIESPPRLFLFAFVSGNLDAFCKLIQYLSSFFCFTHSCVSRKPLQVCFTRCFCKELL